MEVRQRAIEKKEQEEAEEMHRIKSLVSTY